jgi:hypothetical protein
MVTRFYKAAVISAEILALQFILLTNVAASDKRAEGTELIQHAIELTDLQHGGPYHLRWNLTVVDDSVGKREGTDEVTFVSTERWRRELHMTGYDETAVFLGHNMYRTRSGAFTPPSLRTDYAGRLRNLSGMLTFKIIRVFNHKQNGIQARCVLLDSTDSPAEMTWCFDTSTGLPTVQIGAHGYRIEFANYKPWGSKFVPGTVETIVAGKQHAKATLVSVDSGDKDQAHTFDRPAGSTPRRWCDDMVGAQLISIPPPDVRADLRSHKGLELKYEITIDPAGNVTDIVPMEPKPFVDRMVIESLRRSQWNPAMCDGTPVLTDRLFDVGRQDR